MFIRSERLFLRPGWPEDWAEVLAGLGDEEVVRNLARQPWPFGEADARDFATRAQDRFSPHFLVTLPGAAGAQVIGGVGLGASGSTGELGYWIARRHWGQGYATEAVGAVIQIARAIGHRSLSAWHFLDNPASGRVLAKAGFRPFGEVCTRHSRARGGEAPALAYALELATPGDGGLGGDDGEPAMKRAA